MANKYGRMTYEEGKACAELVKKSFIYLNSNWHKFSEDRKFYLAVRIAEKRVPVDVKHSGSFVVELNNNGFISDRDRTLANAISEN